MQIFFLNKKLFKYKTVNNNNYILFNALVYNTSIIHSKNLFTRTSTVNVYIVRTTVYIRRTLFTHY